MTAEDISAYKADLKRQSDKYHLLGDESASTAFECAILMLTVRECDANARQPIPSIWPY